MARTTELPGYWRIVDRYPNKPHGYPKRHRYRAEIWLGEDRPQQRTIKRYAFKRGTEENPVPSGTLEDEPYQTWEISAIDDTPWDPRYKDDKRLQGAGHGMHEDFKNPKKARKWLRNEWDKAHLSEVPAQLVEEGTSRP